jgi:hypothetical protein
MDTGKGKFVEVEMPEGEKARQQIRAAMENKYPEHGGWFRIGEIIIINGSRFRVKGVKPTELRLKLLPKLT